MLNWASLGSHRVERGIQALLRQMYPRLRSLDGAGGDGGRDAQLVTADGKTVFEIKSHGRLTSTARRQIERSLKAAGRSTPDMQRWILVIPMNMTPSRPGVRSSEEAWFEGRLANLAADGVELSWWGQDWLDSQLADRMDIQRYIEGADSQILQRAKDFGQEEAVLAGGAADAATRLGGLQRRVDEISPFWTLDMSTRDGVLETVLRAKIPEAPEVDPITLTPTITFLKDDPEATELRQKFERTLGFGGRVDLPAGYVSEFRVKASPEARLLIPDRDPTTSEFSFVTEQERLERPLRCVCEIRDGDDLVVAAVPIFLRERTAGARGVTLTGSDAAGIISFEIQVPLPEAISGPDEIVTVSGGGLQFELPETFSGYDVDSLLPVVGLLAAADTGRHLRFVMPGLGYLGDGPLGEPAFPEAAATLEYLHNLRRMQEITGTILRFPSGATIGEVRELRRLVRTIDGESVEHDGGIILNLRTDAVADFLTTWTSAPQPEGPGGLLAASTTMVLQIGGLELPYGPAALWAPRPRLTNLDELGKFATDGVPDGIVSVPAKLDPVDHPFVWVSQEQAIGYLTDGERPTTTEPYRPDPTTD